MILGTASHAVMKFFHLEHSKLLIFDKLFSWFGGLQNSTKLSKSALGVAEFKDYPSFYLFKVNNRKLEQVLTYAES